MTVYCKGCGRIMPYPEHYACSCGVGVIAENLLSGLDFRSDNLRPPIAPGVLLDDEPARVYVSRAVLRIVARWAGAIALVGGAAGIMYAEGQRQPAPGVGFGIALALLMGAALLLGRSNDG